MTKTFEDSSGIPPLKEEVGVGLFAPHLGLVVHNVDGVLPTPAALSAVTIESLDVGTSILVSTMVLYFCEMIG